jgi:predicted transcriptional regulator
MLLFMCAGQLAVRRRIGPSVPRSLWLGANRCDKIDLMTKLLEKAIAKARELPAEDQDTVAVAVLAMAEEMPIVVLDEETRAAIREGLEQARRGEFVPDAEIEAIWKLHGL